MRRFWVPFLLLSTALLILSCGSSSRQLQSININGVASCCSASYTAVGTFNAAPMSVTPLPTSWSLGTPPATYQLTTQAFEVDCNGPITGILVTAMSPADPNAPSTGLVANTKMITATTSTPCIEVGAELPSDSAGEKAD